MKKVFAVIACAVVAGALAAQTPAKQITRPAGLGKTAAVGNEEMNIRAYIELLRTDLKKSRAEIMGEVMQLDSDQATQFWPIYKAFETDLAVLGDQVVDVVRKYADTYKDLTDDVADQLARQVLDIEGQRHELKKKYYQRMKSALGGITATRFLQVENQLERLMDLQIAAQLPVASQ